MRSGELRDFAEPTPAYDARRFEGEVALFHVDAVGRRLADVRLGVGAGGRVPHVDVVHHDLEPVRAVETSDDHAARACLDDEVQAVRGAAEIGAHGVRRVVAGALPDGARFEIGFGARTGAARGCARLYHVGTMKLTPSTFVWFNGELVPWDKAQVHVLTHALHYGSAVFEGVRAYAAKGGTAVFGLREHVERLFHSCKIVHLPLRWSQDEVEQAILDTVRANKHDACYIRPLAYRGYGALGVWPEECPVELAIATFPWVKSNEQELIEKGIDVGVSSWRRMAPDTHPAMAKVAGNYVNSQLVILEAKRHGYAEGIVLDVDGYLSEGSGQNLFLVQDGKLWTPPVGSSILAGITRRAVVELATDMGIAIVEQRLPRELLYTCDEMFFTGTVAEITPIRSVDGKPVGDGLRGPVTKRVQQRFFSIARGEIEDRHAWLTRV